MPHYKNGREAKIGDLVVSRGYDGKSMPTYGVLVSITPSSSTCNGMTVPYVPQQALSVTLSYCQHIDDVFPAEE